MKEKLLDDIPYGVIVCQDNGSISYVNAEASKYLKLENDPEKNLLNYLDGSDTESFKSLLKEDLKTSTVIHTKLKGNPDKIFKLVARRSEENANNIIFMLYDNSENALMSENNKILKTISNICKDVFYKDRSTLSDIVADLTKSFHLALASVYFKNGINHLVYCKKNEDNTFTQEIIDGTTTLLSNQDIWEIEKKYTNCKDLLFHVNLKDVELPIVSDIKKKYPEKKISILKLKLNNNNVIGFFEFIEDDNFKLSNAEIEVLESLSQILAYIINNKEQIEDISSYIKQKFATIYKG